MCRKYAAIYATKMQLTCNKNAPDVQEEMRTKHAINMQKNENRCSDYAANMYLVSIKEIATQMPNILKCVKQNIVHTKHIYTHLCTLLMSLTNCTVTAATVSTA